MKLLSKNYKDYIFDIKDFSEFIKKSRERTFGCLIYYVCPFNDSFSLNNSIKSKKDIIYDPIQDKIYYNKIELSRKEKIVLNKLLT